MQQDIIFVKNKYLILFLSLISVLNISCSKKETTYHYEIKEIHCEEMADLETWVMFPYGNAITYVYRESLNHENNDSKDVEEHYRLLNFDDESVISIYPQIEDNEEIIVLLAFDENTFLFTTCYIDKNEDLTYTYRINYQRNGERKILIERKVFDVDKCLLYEVVGDDVCFFTFYNDIKEGTADGIYGNELWKITPEGELECLDHREFEYKNYYLSEDANFYRRYYISSTPDKPTFTTNNRGDLTFNIVEEDNSITSYDIYEASEVGGHMVPIGDIILLDNVDFIGDYTIDNPYYAKLYNPKTGTYTYSDKKWLIGNYCTFSNGYALISPRYVNTSEDCQSDYLVHYTDGKLESIPIDENELKGIDFIKRINDKSAFIEYQSRTIENGKYVYENSFYIFSLVED